MELHPTHIRRKVLPSCRRGSIYVKTRSLQLAAFLTWLTASKRTLDQCPGGETGERPSIVHIGVLLHPDFASSEEYVMAELHKHISCRLWSSMSKVSCLYNGFCASDILHRPFGQLVKFGASSCQIRWTRRRVPIANQTGRFMILRWLP